MTRPSVETTKTSKSGHSLFLDNVNGEFFYSICEADEGCPCGCGASHWEHCWHRSEWEASSHAMDIWPIEHGGEA